MPYFALHIWIEAIISFKTIHVFTYGTWFSEKLRAVQSDRHKLKVEAQNFSLELSVQKTHVVITVKEPLWTTCKVYGISLRALGVGTCLGEVVNFTDVFWKGGQELKDGV